MSYRLRLLALITALAAVPAMLPAQGLGVTAAIFRQFLVDYWDWRLGDEPALATHVGVQTYDHRWRDWSPEARARAREAKQEFLQRLVYIATGNLSSAERLSADLLMDDLRADLDAEPWLQMLRLAPGRGLHTEVFDVVAQMPAGSSDDYERMLARIRALPAYIDQHVAMLRGQLSAGRVQPVAVVDLVLAEIEAQRERPASESILLARFRQFPDQVAPADQQRLRQAATAAYQEAFLPAWTTLATFLRDTYRPAARREPALGTVPGGEQGYRTLVRAYTGSTRTPEEIHRTGLEEVARIAREMERAVREAGFAGTPAAFEAALARRDDARLADEAAVLAYARDVLSRLDAEVPRVAALPRMPLEVRLARLREPVRYTAGTADGRRRAVLEIDPSRPETRLMHRLEALVLHGGVPGRHVQTARARETTSLPAFRRVFDVPAFSNGWALYAESVGTELSTVYRDAASRFGRLASERRQALALVVDTGIHGLGWSRSRAEAYLAEHAPLDATAADLDLYIASPAEALTYKLGEIRIRDERRRVERELGPWFDPREFHEVVLRQGAVPLDVLEEQVTAYIAAARASVQ